MEDQCRICNRKNLSNSPYPDAHFNNKVFKYYRCNDCLSYNVFPTPNENDFDEMYGEKDHTYLKEVKGKLQYDYNYPFAHHQGYQIQFLQQIKNGLKGKTLLDYACGSGFYMMYAQNLGAKVTGVEFDKKFVELLKEKTNFNLYTFEELIKYLSSEKFDYIHLGHVLEHLPNPTETIKNLKQFAHKNTIFLIDGPLEQNPCLHRIYVDFGSKIKGKKYRNAIPQHLTLTTQKSQLLFFEQAGLKKEKYIVTEQYFPLPDKIEASPVKIFNYLVATTSILLSKLIPTAGNIFHYRGKLN